MGAIPLFNRVRSFFKYDAALDALKRRCEDGEQPACDELDGQLILRASRGDRQAMDELLGRHYLAVYRFVRRLTRNDLDAEDAVHTVFVATTLERLDQLAGRIRDGRPFQYRAYLMRSARNHFLDQQKLAWNAWRCAVDDEQTLEWLCDKGQDCAADDGADHLATEQLIRALTRLPAEQEEVLTLKVLGYSMQEIADIQDVPLETARDRRKTAVRKLKAWLADMER